jgi:sugar lactone lactonase YvrE
MLAIRSVFSLRSALAVFVSSIVLFSANALAWDRGHVDKFATIPAGFKVEGLTVDRHGDVFVTSFAGPATKPGQLFVFDGDNGHLKRQLDVTGSSQALLGLDFNPVTGDLLILDFGNPRVLKVNPFTGANTVFTTIPGGPGVAGPNALTFDSDGNVYVSDSFQGVIWKTPPNGSPTPTAWVTDPLLRTTGTPPFGANGVKFNKAQSILFVANTGDDRLIQIPVTGGTPGAPSIFTNSINGADGIFLDDDDNIWVAANQSDEIVVVDPTGKVIAKLGDFDGIDNKGAPIGLLFPASPAIFGGWLYVTNLSLDLRTVGAGQAVDSQWAAQITTNTVSRLRARIPRVQQ